MKIRIWKPEKRKMHFLERGETAFRDGVKESVPMAKAKNLLKCLYPFVKRTVEKLICRTEN